MNTNELDFEFPEELIATERAPSTRVMIVENSKPSEITIEELLQKFEAGDVLVINNTQVLKRRVFTLTESATSAPLEILFLSENHDGSWQVLCQASKWKQGIQQTLPGGMTLELVSRGRPQTVMPSERLTESFFTQHGELPLPPYIQKARANRHNTNQDNTAYQTKWAEKPGSLAAPTASLHFTQSHLDQLKERGVKVAYMTLHVGLGTFLPITGDTLDQHEMHFEWSEVPKQTWQAIQDAKVAKHKIWVIGTTVTRALESIPKNILKPDADGNFVGETNLFIRPASENAPGFEFKVIDRLLTNFHQPKSTLLALVSAFSDLQTVKSCYRWAIEKKFRLFSYGDLTVWIK